MYCSSNAPPSKVSPSVLRTEAVRAVGADQIATRARSLRPPAPTSVAVTPSASWSNAGQPDAALDLHAVQGELLGRIRSVAYCGMRDEPERHVRRHRHLQLGRPAAPLT